MTGECCAAPKEISQSATGLIMTIQAAHPCQLTDQGPKRQGLRQVRRLAARLGAMAEPVNKIGNHFIDQLYTLRMTTFCKEEVIKHS